MRIAVINPNTTASSQPPWRWRAGTEILGMQSMAGPEAIEGPFDGELSVPGLLKQVVAAEMDNVDAHIIACFEAPLLIDARKQGEASR
ncbi:aspartate/glutamate racemase family protein [Mesorhizobium sp. M0306]